MILVNLDDNCFIEEIETEGVFIQSGDIIFLTAREWLDVNLRWVINQNKLDQDVLELFDSREEPATQACEDNGDTQLVIMLLGGITGQTELVMDLIWGDNKTKRISIDVYVNIVPTLSQSKRSYDWCDDCREDRYEDYDCFD